MADKEGKCPKCGADIMCKDTDMWSYYWCTNSECDYCKSIDWE